LLVASFLLVVVSKNEELAMPGVLWTKKISPSSASKKSPTREERAPKIFTRTYLRLARLQGKCSKQRKTSGTRLPTRAPLLPPRNRSSEEGIPQSKKKTHNRNNCFRKNRIK
jgi:hypothetical protein